MVTHAFNISAWEAKKGGALRVQRQPGLNITTWPDTRLHACNTSIQKDEARRV